MDSDRIRLVADRIERDLLSPSTATAPDLGFSMLSFVNYRQFEDDSGRGCGTTACIAGWAVAVSEELSAEGLMSRYEGLDGCWDADGMGGMDDMARDWLQLSSDQTRDLFFWYPGSFAVPGSSPYDRPGPAQAVAVLRHLADTGIVDWSVGK